MESLASCQALVVEDDEILAEYVCTVLGRRGASTEQVHDGRSGIRQVRVRHPDLVVSDWRMPWVSGLRVLKEARTAPGRSVGFIMMTAYHTPSLRQQCMEAGADVYLEKPFRRDDLAEAVQTALGAIGRPAE